MKRLLMNCNRLKGIPTGRHVQGDTIIYSGIEEVYQQDRSEPLTKQFDKDAKVADEIFIYVGKDRREGIWNLLDKLKKKGRNLTIVACCCLVLFKDEFAKERKIKLAWCECKGRTAFKHLLAGENVNAKIPEPEKPWQPPIVA